MSKEFHRFMSTLEDSLGPALALHALTLWHRMAADADLREPLVQGDVGARVRFCWTKGSRLLDVEVDVDGRFEWFFHDNTTEEVDGTVNEPEVELPPAFFERLRSEATRTS